MKEFRAAFDKLTKRNKQIPEGNSVREQPGRREILKKAEPKETDPRLLVSEITQETLRALAEDNTAPLIAHITEKLRTLDLSPDDLVFRGVSHPKGNITTRLIFTHGTDRFVGYGQGRIPTPEESNTVIPYRNQGETAALTADTYCVADLGWALAFTNLRLAQGQERFMTGEQDSFLIAYKKSAISVTRTPPGGGEQWRATFLEDPQDALAAVIKFIPPKQT